MRGPIIWQCYGPSHPEIIVYVLIRVAALSYEILGLLDFNHVSSGPFKKSTEFSYSILCIVRNDNYHSLDNLTWIVMIPLIMSQSLLSAHLFWSLVERNLFSPFTICPLLSADLLGLSILSCLQIPNGSLHGVNSNNISQLNVTHITVLRLRIKA